MTDRQRIDKWLWHARVVRTRTAAAALVSGGHVRLNCGRVAATSQPVRAGDVVTVALDRAVRILKVTGFAERRGDADAARLICEDLTPYFTGSRQRAGNCRARAWERAADQAGAPRDRPAAGASIAPACVVQVIALANLRVRPEFE